MADLSGHATHPGAIVLVWVGVFIAIMWLTVVQTALALVLTTAGVFGAACLARARLIALVWRGRFLAFVVALSSAVMPPGELLPIFSLATYEGLLVAVEQLLLLCFTLASVALLMQLLAPAELVIGMLFVLQPMGWFGVDITRIAVRMSLVLDGLTRSGTGLPSQLGNRVPEPNRNLHSSSQKDTMLLEQRKWRRWDTGVCGFACLPCLFLGVAAATGYA